MPRARRADARRVRWCEQPPQLQRQMRCGAQADFETRLRGTEPPTLERSTSSDARPHPPGPASPAPAIDTKAVSTTPEGTTPAPRSLRAARCARRTDPPDRDPEPGRSPQTVPPTLEPPLCHRPGRARKPGEARAPASRRGCSNQHTTDRLFPRVPALPSSLARRSQPTATPVNRLGRSGVRPDPSSFPARSDSRTHALTRATTNGSDRQEIPQRPRPPFLTRESACRFSRRRSLRTFAISLGRPLAVQATRRLPRASRLHRRAPASSAHR